MKYVSITIILFATALLLIGLNYDTTVPTNYGSARVHNIGLITERLNILIASGVAFVAGSILFGFSKSKASRETTSDQRELTRQCPHCAEKIQAAAVLCRYCHSKVEPVEIQPNPKQSSEMLDEISAKLSTITKWGCIGIYFSLGAAVVLILNSFSGVTTGGISIVAFASSLCLATMLAAATLACQKRPLISLATYTAGIFCHYLFPSGLFISTDSDLTRFAHAIDFALYASIAGVVVSAISEYNKRTSPSTEPQN